VLRRREPLPLYFQLETLLRQQIDTGEYESGNPLPSENDLAVQHGISRVTVREALRRLEEDGFVVRQRGRGTFVAPGVRRTGKILRDLSNVVGFEAELRRLGHEPQGEVLAIEEVPATGQLAQVMRIPAGSVLVRMRRRGTSRGEPLWLETRYFPADVGKDLIASGGLTSPAIIRLLEEQLAEHIGIVRIELEAALATEPQAELLQILPGTAIQVYEAAAETNSGRVVQFVRVIFPSGHFRLTFQVTRDSANAQAPALVAGASETL